MFKIFSFFKRTNYLYHATQIELLESIKRGGLDPKYCKLPYICFTRNPYLSFLFAPNKPTLLIVVDESELDIKYLEQSNRYTYQVNYSRKIPPKLIIGYKKIILNEKLGELRDRIEFQDI